MFCKQFCVCLYIRPSLPHNLSHLSKALLLLTLFGWSDGVALYPNCQSRIMHLFATFSFQSGKERVREGHSISSLFAVTSSQTRITEMARGARKYVLIHPLKFIFCERSSGFRTSMSLSYNSRLHSNTWLKWKCLDELPISETRNSKSPSVWFRYACNEGH